MSWGMVAVGGATVIGAVVGSQASGRASDKQSKAAQQGIDATNFRFEELAAMLEPYREGGEEAFAAQQALIGLAGDEEQQQAIEQIQQSPQFQAQMQQGEEAILQNASATGGLRGGNTQNALATFRPQLLADNINQRFQQLGGISSVGQNAAAMVGNQGMEAGAMEADLLAQIGAVQAGNSITQANIANQAGGQLAGMGASYLNNRSKF